VAPDRSCFGRKRLAMACSTRSWSLSTNGPSKLMTHFLRPKIQMQFRQLWAQAIHSRIYIKMIFIEVLYFGFGFV
jgi:hypothetical protein